MSKMVERSEMFERLVGIVFNMSDCNREETRAIVAAVLHGMRNPTDAMVKAGDVWSDGPGYAHKVLNAMIDEALK